MTCPFFLYSSFSIKIVKIKIINRRTDFKPEWTSQLLLLDQDSRTDTRLRNARIETLTTLIESWRERERETKAIRTNKGGETCAAMIVSVEHVSRWWRTSGRVNPHGGPVIIPGDRRNGSERSIHRDSVAPWRPRGDVCSCCGAQHRRAPRPLARRRSGGERNEIKWSEEREEERERESERWKGERGEGTRKTGRGKEVGGEEGPRIQRLASEGAECQPDGSGSLIIVITSRGCTSILDHYRPLHIYHLSPPISIDLCSRSSS